MRNSANLYLSTHLGLKFYQNSFKVTGYPFVVIYKKTRYKPLAANLTENIYEISNR